MKKKKHETRANRITLNRETLRRLDPAYLGQAVAAGVFTVGCPPTRTCDTCVPCTG